MENTKQAREALVVVDMQNDFISGSLAVEGADKVIERINRLTEALSRNAANLIATTQDWHPAETAHFSTEPNFVNTWPEHCVAGTVGAELHPDLLLAKQPELSTRFIKGDTACQSPEDDTSYTGVLAYRPASGEKLPDFLHRHSPETIYVAGLALGDGDKYPLCVDSTARDLHNDGFDVVLVTDAAEAVLPKNRQACLNNMASLGIKLMTTKDVVSNLNRGTRHD